MINDLGGVTSQLVRLALDASILKHEVIANNIANANTPEFKPQQVSFEQHLLSLEENRSVQDNSLLKSQLKDLEGKIRQGELVEDSGLNKVQLDMEMKELAENVLRYRALLEGLSKRGSIIHMAISGQGGR